MQQKVKMPTTADLASMWQASGLKEKIIYTFIMIAIFRLGSLLPIFGINSANFKAMTDEGLLGFLNMFSGGALGNVSIFALGIGPFITASIIIQLVSVVIPSLEKLQKEEGEAGRRKLAQYTRVFTVALAVFQSVIFMILLSKFNGSILPGVNPGLFFISSVTVLTAGSMLVMWISELITEKGIGNGGSLIIFVGIISRIPQYTKDTAKHVHDSGLQFPLMILLAIFFATMVLIVIMQEATRKVVIVNPKRQVGNKVYGGVNTHIPFKLNPGGVMPIIFAIAILLFPTTITGLITKTGAGNPIVQKIALHMNDILSPSHGIYYVLYFTLIVTLTFFYASIMPNMQPKEIATNLKKYGSSIPGIKPGKATADALDKILSKTTFIGALALGTIALVPSFASHLTGITTLQGIGATSLIIMVGVALDLLTQVKTHLLARNYESFLKD